MGKAIYFRHHFQCFGVTAFIRQTDSEFVSGFAVEENMMCTMLGLFDIIVTSCFFTSVYFADFNDMAIGLRFVWISLNGSFNYRCRLAV